MALSKTELLIDNIDQDSIAYYAMTLDSRPVTYEPSQDWYNFARGVLLRSFEDKYQDAVLYLTLQEGLSLEEILQRAPITEVPEGYEGDDSDYETLTERAEVEDYRLPNAVIEKMLEANHDGFFGKVFRLAKELWEHHGVYFIFGCSDNMFEEEQDTMNELYEMHEPTGVVTLFRNILFTIWREDDQNYLAPLLEEIGLDFHSTPGGIGEVELLPDGFTLPEITPEDFQ